MMRCPLLCNCPIAHLIIAALFNHVLGGCNWLNFKKYVL